MNIPSRNKLEDRLQALVADMLDELETDYPDGFDLGVVLIGYEVQYPREGSSHLKRSAAGYTPDDDVGTWMSYWCSDHRPWVQRAITDSLYDLARWSAPPVEDADADADDDEDEPATRSDDD